MRSMWMRIRHCRPRRLLQRRMICSRMLLLCLVWPLQPGRQMPISQAAPLAMPLQLQVTL